MMIMARQHVMRDSKRLTDPWSAFSGITPLRDTPHAPYLGSTPCHIG